MTDDSESEPISNIPLTPNAIPSGEIPQTKSHISKDAKSILNPLDFSPKTSLTKFLRLPGIFIFCTLSGYLLGKFQFNFLFLLPIAHISYYIFTRHVKKYSRTLDVMDREISVSKKSTDFESVEWINHIIKQFWDVSEQSVSSIIYNEVNNVLQKVAKKKGLEVKLSEITLGTRPPVIERISYKKCTENEIVLEIATHFIPVQASDQILAYFKKERSHWNTYIELQVILANLITVPILVKNFTFNGYFKIAIDLTQKLPFAKSLRFSFLDMPIIDFELYPLKIVDMLDLPYVGSLLNSVLHSTIKNMCLEPKAIEVDMTEIAKYRGKTIGVVYVFIHSFETEDESTYWISIDHSGRPIGQTDKKSGKNPIFQEGFYDIVSDTSKFLGIKVRSTELPLYTGKIFLRNLNRSSFSERLIVSNDNSHRFLNVTTQFYPTSEFATDSAIIYLNLISIDELQNVGDAPNRLYSTYCEVSLESREAVVSRKVLKYYESKKIFATKNPFYNENFKFFVRRFTDYVIKIKVIDEKDKTEIGKVIIPCIDIENNQLTRYRISSVESGDLNLKFSCKYIDMSDYDFDEKDVAPIEPVNESKDDELPLEEQIDVLSVVNPDAIPGSCMEVNRSSYSVRVESKSSVKEKPDISLGIYSTELVTQRFINYKKILKVNINSVSSKGIFKMVFETDNLTLSSPIFSTDIEIKAHVFIPISTEILYKARLFRCATSGHELVSEESISPEDKVIFFSKIKVELTTESCDLIDYTGDEDDDCLKIQQIRIGSYSKEGDYTFNFRTESIVQNLKLKHRKSTFLLGRDSIVASLRENNRTICRSVIPKVNAVSDMKFGNSLTAKLFSKIQVCNFKTAPYFNRGELEVFILKVDGLNMKGQTSLDPYVKVFVNKEKIFKTQTKSKANNLIFNESFKIKVLREFDMIGFHLYNNSRLSIDELLGAAEISLLNVTEGYTRISIPLTNAEANILDNPKIEVILSFKGEANMISR